MQVRHYLLVQYSNIILLVGVTKAIFINLALRDSQCCKSTAQLQWHLSDMNVIFSRKHLFWWQYKMIKNWEKEEIWKNLMQMWGNYSILSYILIPQQMVCDRKQQNNVYHYWIKPMKKHLKASRSVNLMFWPIPTCDYVHEQMHHLKTFINCQDVLFYIL